MSNQLNQLRPRRAKRQNQRQEPDLFEMLYCSDVSNRNIVNNANNAGDPRLVFGLDHRKPIKGSNRKKFYGIPLICLAIMGIAYVIYQEFLED